MEIVHGAATLLTCDTCPHCAKEGKSMFCRYNAPQTFMVANAKGDVQFIGAWPPTNPEAWCRSHPSREEGQQKIH